MSREIKFRAWNKNLKTFAPDNCSIQIQGDDAHVSFDFFDGNFDTAVWCLDDVELMQFTGLKDINGIEIYEGDVVKSHFYGEDYNGIAKINYDDSSAAFVYDSAEQDAFVYGAENGQLEVVGNIYENPELLNP